MSEASACCIFCSAVTDLATRSQTVAGEKVTVCNLCASAGRAALDAGFMQGSLGCLHLTACEIEAQLSDQYARQRRAKRRIADAFGRSAFRSACACATCSRWQARADLGMVEDDDAVGVYTIDGQAVFTDLDMSDQPLWVLRSMNGTARVPAPDGRMVPAKEALPLRVEENRSETERPPVGVLGEKVLASAQAGAWTHVGQSASKLAVKQAAKDAQAAAHWRMVNKYGPGLRDGDYWQARDGCVIPLDAADRVLPMTEADKLALAADKRRAAAWRSSATTGAIPEQDDGWPDIGPVIEGLGLHPDDDRHLHGVARFCSLLDADALDEYLRKVRPEAAAAILRYLGLDE